ncbi:MAG: hypothetical protein LUF26_05960, partial [Firmicutes bacterium]|nr:hypothetical protein [Bacillota bacterium]
MKKISFLILSITIIMISNIAFAFENSTIATDGSNFYAIKDDNSLWAWGENKNGEVGNGTTEACDDPTKIMEDVIYVSPQYAVKSDNTLWTWGKYSDFFSEDNASLVPVKVMDNVKAADVGWSSTLIIKEDNSLWGIGYNNYGQLGQGEILRSSDDLETEYCDPSVYEQPVKIMNNVLDAEAGVNHSIALKTDGSVYTFGAGYYGQLGYGDYLFLSNVPTKVMENVKDIAAGSSSSFALKDDNTYWWCGTLFGEHNDSQELDYYEFEQLDDDIKDISVHYKTSLVLKNDGSLWQYSFTGDGSESVKKKISDNINCISGDDSNGYKTLVLNNDGELFLYDLDGEYTSEKIMDNVKLQEENVSAEQTNFLDIESKSDEAQKAVNALTRAGII